MPFPARQPGCTAGGDRLEHCLLVLAAGSPVPGAPGRPHLIPQLRRHHLPRRRSPWPTAQPADAGPAVAPPWSPVPQRAPAPDRRQHRAERQQGRLSGVPWRHAADGLVTSERS